MKNKNFIKENEFNTRLKESKGQNEKVLKLTTEHFSEFDEQKSQTKLPLNAERDVQENLISNLRIVPKANTLNKTNSLENNKSKSSSKQSEDSDNRVGDEHNSNSNSKKSCSSSELDFDESRHETNPELEDDKEEEFRKIEKRDKIDDSDSEDSETELTRQSGYILLPDNAYKRRWDIAIAILLIYTCLVTPFRIAFIDDYEISFFYCFDLVIDLFFFVDLVLNFFTAYTDNEENIIRNHKKICIHYVSSWFIIDFLSIIPVNLILHTDDPFSTGNNPRISFSFGRFARIPKFYRLFRLVKLFRMAKVVRKGNVTRLTRYFLEKLKVNANVERLIYFILAFLILNHISACIFYFIAKMEEFSPDSWVTRLGFIDLPQYELYIIAFYWTLTTVTTVGYGDINAGTITERCYNLFIMSFGVLMYSFAIGSLTSIVSTMDAKTSEMNQKLQALHTIKQEYKIDQDIYEKVRKIIKYDLSLNQKDKINFLKELPNKLRLELSRIIHDNVIKKMQFFQDKPELIAFAAPLLKPIKFSQNEALYRIGDSMDEMYFISKGTVSLLLSEEYGSKELIEVKKNHHFGEIEMCLNEKLSHNIKIKSRHAELFILKKNDFLKLSVNFKDIIQKFLNVSLMKYLKFNDEKKKAMKEYEDKYGKRELSPMKIYEDQEEEENKDELEQINEEVSEEEEGGGDKPKKKQTHIDIHSERSDNESEKVTGSIVSPKENQKKIIVKKKESEGVFVCHPEKEGKEEIEMKGKQEMGKSKTRESISSPADKEDGACPRIEMNEHVNNVKTELFTKFCAKIERMIKLLESNHITFANIADDRNPLVYLQKLKNTQDISERNQIIEQLESVLNTYY